MIEKSLSLSVKRERLHSIDLREFFQPDPHILETGYQQLEIPAPLRALDGPLPTNIASQTGQHAIAPDSMLGIGQENAKGAELRPYSINLFS